MLADQPGHRLIDLDVAVVGLGAGGVNADGEEPVALGGRFEGGDDGVAELLLADDQMVGRRHDHCGVGILLVELVGGVGHAGGRVALVGLQQDILLRNLRQLFVDQAGVTLRRDDEDVFRRNDRGIAVESHLQERPADAQDVDELLGTGLAADWPEAAADTARHDDTVMIMVHFVCLYVTIFLSKSGKRPRECIPLRSVRRRRRLKPRRTALPSAHSAQRCSGWPLPPAVPA